jgi:hypothetical protein
MITHPQSLVKGGAFFFFFMSFFSAFFYGVGVRQGFTDPTQLMLLRVTSFCGLVLGIAALYGVVLNLWLLTRGRDPRLLAGIAVYALAAAFGILTAAAAVFIMILSGGTGE